MKKSRLLSTVCAGFLLLIFQVANAVSIPVDGQIHLATSSTFNPATDTFDPATDTVGTFTAFVPFEIYVIADNFTDTSGINGYEFSLFSPDYASFADFGLVLNPVTAVNFGTAPLNNIVGTGDTLPNSGQVILATWTLFPLANINDVVFTLGASTPSSGSGAEPAWVNSTFDLYDFGFSSDLLLNQVQAPTPPGSPVPIPAAVWLFGSGLLGLVGIARRKKAA